MVTNSSLFRLVQIPKRKLAKSIMEVDGFNLALPQNNT